MKTQLACTANSARRTRNGSAVLVVLILLLAMSAIVMSNQFALRHLKREIKLIEQQQLKKFEKPIEPRQDGSGQF